MIEYHEIRCDPGPGIDWEVWAWIETGAYLLWRSNGWREWRFNKKLHRLDGPARIDENNRKCWFLEGHHMTYDQWRKARKPYLIEQKAQEIKDLVI